MEARKPGSGEAGKQEESGDCYLGIPAGTPDDNPLNVIGTAREPNAEDALESGSLFYSREGKSYWRCGWCAAEREYLHPGAYVKVANVVLAVVCTDSCGDAAAIAVGEKLASHRRILAKQRALGETTA